jgi:nucleotide-binding universal stress UspA family protein
MGHPIVAGVDGSRQSCAVASVAAGLARVLGHRLILAHAAADPSTFRFPDAGERGRQRARTVENGFALLEGVAATLPDAVGQTAVVLGSPNEALASFCNQEQAALLVIGSRGRGRLPAAFLGHHGAGSCPVVVVPRGIDGSVEDGTPAADTLLLHVEPAILSRGSAGEPCGFRPG